MTMTMVSARVDAGNKEKAERVLKREGMSYSQLIRRVTDYVAETGELPMLESVTLDLIKQEKRRRQMEALEYIKNLRVPPDPDGLTDEEILDQEKMRRFGYGMDVEQ